MAEPHVKYWLSLHDEGLEDSKDLKSRLEKHILETGYPLEIDIASALEKRGWNVTSNVFYVDPETSKPRELDLSAFLFPSAFLEPSTPLPLLWIQMLVECKKSAEYSLVLFPRKSYTPLDVQGQIGDLPSILGKVNSTFRATSFPLGLYVDIGMKLHFNALRPLSSVYTFTKPPSNRSTQRESKHDVFEAVTTLMKVQESELDLWIEAGKSTSGFYPLVLYFLVTVLDAPIFEAKVLPGKVELSESNHSAIRASYRSKGYDYPVGRTIDVVNPDYFPKYLDIVADEVKRIWEDIRQNQNMLRYLSKNQTSADSP